MLLMSIMLKYVLGRSALFPSSSLSSRKEESTF